VVACTGIVMTFRFCCTNTVESRLSDGEPCLRMLSDGEKVSRHLHSRIDLPWLKVHESWKPWRSKLCMLQQHHTSHAHIRAYSREACTELLDARILVLHTFSVYSTLIVGCLGKTVGCLIARRHIRIVRSLYNFAWLGLCYMCTAVGRSGSPDMCRFALVCAAQPLHGRFQSL
jgi:hypothetical protein